MPRKMKARWQFDCMLHLGFFTKSELGGDFLCLTESSIWCEDAAPLKRTDIMQISKDN